MKLDAQGWLSGVRRVASPNFDARPPHAAIDMLVIHGISLPPGVYGGNAIERFFTNTLDHLEHAYYGQIRGLTVSSHFLVRRSGQVIQFVPTSKRAWHAGVSTWHGRSRCNDFSIGIELEGSDFEPYTEQQYLALARLTRRLKRDYQIKDIVGHSDIAPQRKTDPGPFFDWGKYRARLK